MTKVFLGGTCAGSKWREELIPMLKIDYFNPVVPDWTEECYKEELKQREECDFVLYVITPQMRGVYSIAEVVDDSNKRPTKTMLCVLREYQGQKFTKGEWLSLRRVCDLVRKNGGFATSSLQLTIKTLNKRRYLNDTDYVLDSFVYDGDLSDSEGNYYVPNWAVTLLDVDALYYKEKDLYIKLPHDKEELVEVGDEVILRTDINNGIFTVEVDIIKQPDNLLSYK